MSLWGVTIEERFGSYETHSKIVVEAEDWDGARHVARLILVTWRGDDGERAGDDQFGYDGYQCAARFYGADPLPDTSVEWRRFVSTLHPDVGDLPPVGSDYRIEWADDGTASIIIEG
ncbi:MAG: hypothetical protein GEU80_14185 [Dehalococcoidia bacterium]|nr:hypothetical protein [Dehalococcoidia bacterium]